MTAVAELLKRYDIKPQRALSQCFLHDPQVIERIVRYAAVKEGDVVVEIGAGLGVMTRLLLDQCCKVIALEKDPRLCEVLRAELGQFSTFELIEGDALVVNFLALEKRVGRFHVLGNIPYGITGPLLFKILDERTAVYTATLMVQKEVAERWVAKTSSKDYGIPTVMIQQYADVTYGFTVGRGAFIPAPNVESAVARLTILDRERSAVSDEDFRRVVRASFSARRKTIQNNLRFQFPETDTAKWLARAEIDGRRRGETLSAEEFAKLANAYSAKAEDA